MEILFCVEGKSHKHARNEEVYANNHGNIKAQKE